MMSPFNLITFCAFIMWNRLHVALRLYSNWSHKTSKCGLHLLCHFICLATLWRHLLSVTEQTRQHGIYSLNWRLIFWSGGKKITYSLSVSKRSIASLVSVTSYWKRAVIKGINLRYLSKLFFKLLKTVANWKEISITNKRRKQKGNWLTMSRVTQF